jgi:GntR family transcriptional regulator/MocR family aminotransferase
MKKNRTNLSDWSAMIPLLQGEGSRASALYAGLRGLVESGQLEPGAKLPPSRQLATQLSMSRGAVVAAFDQLVADGFAEAIVGSGTFVAQAVPRPRQLTVKPTFAPNVPPFRPGRMGSAMMDDVAFATLRRLIAKDLRQPALRGLHYSDPRGSEALRSEIANYLRAARGVRLHADQVMITSGSQQALDFVLRALLSPGDPVWMEDPGYPAVVALMRGNGLKIAPVPVDAEGLDVAAGRSSSPRARAVYVTPSHQYPLGVTMTMPRRLALLDWARSSSAWIIEDDYDSEFRYAGPPLTSLQGMDGADRVIYLGTFSKALFPGLRMGYVVLPAAIMERVIALRERTDRYPQTLAEGALAAFLREGHFAGHLRRARKRAKASRDALVTGLTEGPIRAMSPAQGLHLVAQLPRRLSEGRAAQLAHEAGLGVRPLSTMYLASKPKSGLLIGFSAFSPDDFYRASLAFSRSANHEQGRR